MRTSNVALLAEIDILELRIGIDANELEVVKEFDRMTDEIAELRDFLVKVSTCEIETFSFEVGDSGDTDCIEYVCTDIVEEANELLANYK